MAAQSNDPGEQNRIKLPGFGLPCNDWGSDTDVGMAERLSAVAGWNHDLMTIRERCMLFFINSITDKPKWYRKVHEKEVVARWEQETKSLDWSKVGFEHGSMSTKMFEFCIEEIRAKAILYEETGIVPVLDVSSCVLKSDTAISANLKEQLKLTVGVLEHVPEHHKDWQPGSDGKVIDLVRPSLFPLIYTRSRILPDSTIGLDACIDSIGKGEIIPNPLLHPEPPKERMPGGGGFSSVWSSRFQWLPSNISFPDGENAKIDTYINNLHPEHRVLYGVIEKIITKAVPFWNIVMQCHHEGMLGGERRADCRGVEYSYLEGFDLEAAEEELHWEDLQELRTYDMPEPEEFKALKITAEHVNDRFAFLNGGEKKLQVIVKLANIHLTPEKPNYAGEPWHIEGQLNEHIVSTALYYYDDDNITDSHLSFCTKVGTEDFYMTVRHDMDDSRGIDLIFGLGLGDPSVQDLGFALTREDRFIVFPNGFENRVGSFKLADATRPGHRKMLALFLVAPTCPIISTANVPPQQRDWWLKRVKEVDSRIAQLPTELIDEIGKGVQDFPIGLDEAKELREDLIKERKRMDRAVGSRVESKRFKFCVH